MDSTSDGINKGTHILRSIPTQKNQDKSEQYPVMENCSIDRSKLKSTPSQNNSNELEKNRALEDIMKTHSGLKKTMRAPKKEPIVCNLLGSIN